MSTVQTSIEALAAARSRSVPELHKVKAREDLKPRREPYWGARIAEGRHVGLRKISAERASWIARIYVDDGSGHKVQKYQSLGALTSEFGYDQAVSAAR